MHGVYTNNNEDDIFIKILISNKLFLNYKFTREQKEAVNWQLLFVFMFMCIQFAAWNLGRNQILKSKVPYSRLCSVINTAKTTFLFQFGFLTNVFKSKVYKWTRQTNQKFRTVVSEVSFCMRNSVVKFYIFCLFSGLGWHCLDRR